MAPKGEPPWLTGCFTAVGLVLIIVVGVVLQLAFVYWPVTVLLLAGSAVAWWHYKSPRGIERRLQDEQQELYGQIQRLIEARALPDAGTFAGAVIQELRATERAPHFNILIKLYHVACALYEEERFTTIEPPPPAANTLEGARWRDAARLQLAKLHDPNCLDAFRSAVTWSYLDFTDLLPASAVQDWDAIDNDADEFLEDRTPHTFLLPLPALLPKAGPAVEELILPFYSKDSRPYFVRLREQLDKNLERASGVTPTAYEGDDPVRTYLGETPLSYIFEAEVPFELPEKLRFEGHWIVAPPGRGKTTLLSALLAEDLRRDASIIVIDSKGDLLDPIRRMKGLEDRLVILEPDAQHPLALNPLDISRDNPALAPTDRILRTNRAVSHLEQLFGGLFEAKMTSLQARFFRIVLRAIVTAARTPTLSTFRDICQGGYEEHLALEKLDEEDRSFFLKEFNTKTYADTRNQVLWRLGLLLDNPVFKAMFSAPRTKVDIGALMDGRKVVLINNSKALLDDDGAEFFGRFFLALVRSAAQQRSRLKDHNKVPVYFYMDECQTVIRRDDNIATIIDECRSQKIALIMAHQRVAQITSANVLDALSNCALRFANSDEDAKYLSVGLRTTPEFLRQPRGSFAAFVRDLTDTAIALRVPNVRLTECERMSNDDYKGMLDRIHAQYCVDGGPVVSLHKPDLSWTLEPENSSPPNSASATKKPTPAKNETANPDEYTGPSKY